MSTTPTVTSPSCDRASHRVDKRKRNRIPLSCKPCRMRKLKCNRLSPCENCIKREEIPNCTYAPRPPPRRKKPLTFIGIEDRIKRLEELLLSLCSSERGRNTNADNSLPSNLINQPIKRDRSRSEDVDGMDVSVEDKFDSRERKSISPAPSTDWSGKEEESDEVEDIENPPQFVRVRNDGSYFQGEAHLDSILYEIQELKHHFMQKKGEKETINTGIFPIVIGTNLTTTHTKSLLLDLIPSKATLDFLVNRYFELWHPIIPLIHRPTFLKEVEEFSKNRTTIDPLWLALLFNVLSLSLKTCMPPDHDYAPLEYSGRVEEASQRLYKAAQEALVIGDFTRNTYYQYNTMKTLLLLALGMFQSSNLTWLFLGWVCRLAISMGLHRDPEQYKLPVFEVEMRRRLWSALSAMDLAFSLRLSLPTIIRNNESDTKEPLNLHDEDISPNTTEKPVAYNLEVRTIVSYQIVKTRLLNVAGKISNLINSTGPKISYDEILKLDGDLRKAKAFPSFLTLNKDRYDPPHCFVKQQNLEIIFSMGIVNLHRRYMKGAIINPRYKYSREETIKACLRLLDLQYFMFKTRRKHLKSILRLLMGYSNSEFMQMIIIVCIDLWHTYTAGKLEAENDIEYCGTAAKVAALQRTKALFEEGYYQGQCDYYKAIDIISTVLDKIKTPYPESQINENMQPPQSPWDSSSFVEKAQAPTNPTSNANADNIGPHSHLAMLPEYVNGHHQHQEQHPQPQMSGCPVQYNEVPSLGFPSSFLNSNYPPFSMTQMDIVGGVTSLNWERWDIFIERMNAEMGDSQWWQGET